MYAVCTVCVRVCVGQKRIGELEKGRADSQKAQVRDVVVVAQECVFRVVVSPTCVDVWH